MAAVIAYVWERRRSVAVGWAAGVLAVALFIGIHAVVVTPIWRAIPQGLLFAAYGGALAGLAHARLRRLPAFASGIALGALAALWLAPFLIGGMLRTAGQPAVVWASMLAALVAGWLALVVWLLRREGGDGRDLAWALAAVIPVNALAMLFLTFITMFHELPVQPVPMTLVLGGIYVVAGATLGRLSARWRLA